MDQTPPFPDFTVKVENRNHELLLSGVKCYLILTRFFFEKSVREILNGMAHVAITLTTLKAEKVT